MAVSMALLKRVCCPNAISIIKPSSTKEEVVLVQDVVILGLTVGHYVHQIEEQSLPPAEIK
jgi:sulfur transfer complex TusBCD TusB component (DsrH family)